MEEVEKFIHRTTTSALLRLVILLVYPTLLCHSQTIIKTLPGFQGDLPFKLETGYVGVGERDYLQLFYYFVESQRTPKYDPLIIWIPGGPGCTAFGGFFYGSGPFTFDYTKSKEDMPNFGLKLNPHTWTKVANIIFLDPPAAGFSYAKPPEAYKNSDTLSAMYTYEFLRKWLESHPNFINNPLYVYGASYSGIIVPVLVQDIYNGNEAGNEPVINIKGYILGNPLTDRNIDFNSKIPYAHQFALLSDEIYESTKTSCHGDYIHVNPSNVICANNLQEVDKCLEYIYEYHILEPICISQTRSSDLLKFDGSSPEKNPIHNLIQLPQLAETWCRENTYVYASIWGNNESVRKALHIREGTITEWERCNTDHYMLGKNDTAYYRYDVSSSVGYHKNLTKKNCRALIHSGDHDMGFPYVGTRKWIHTLNLTVDRTWTPWFVNNQVAGYTETFTHSDFSLTYVTVKGAGHVPHEFKPEECVAMVDRWFGQNPI